jgi:predicted AAA+ superfamily ATPase
VRDYFQILEDTLIGVTLPPIRSPGRKAVATSKFYFFDIGVANVLLGRGPVTPGSESFGRSLEHLVFLELRAFNDYRRLDRPIRFWGVHGQAEVDFIFGEDTAIEVKGTGRVSPRDLRGLRRIVDDLPLRRRIVVCSEPQPRRTDDGIEVMPVQAFLHDLWENSLGST